ncbi:MAG: type II secretion system F family protein [Silvanigrellaceae bacterium]
MKLFGEKSESLQWEQGDVLFRRISEGLTRSSNQMRPAVIWALSQTPCRSLRDLSRKACLPLSTSATATNRQHRDKNQPRMLLEAAVGELVRPSSSANGFSAWFSIFNELHRVRRWILRQSAQSRIQAFFLMGFVPLVSIFLGLANLETFSTNLSVHRGQLMFLVALAFYLAGIFWVRSLVRSGQGLVSPRGLSDIQGRIGFLTEILAASANSSTRIGQLGSACAGSQRVSIQGFGRRLGCGIASRAVHDASTLGHRETEAIELFNLKAGFVDRPDGGHRWLLQRYRSIFEDFQDECSRSAALLSMRLLFPMAIFFLPALFLFLALCGFSLTMDAVN